MLAATKAVTFQPVISGVERITPEIAQKVLDEQIELAALNRDIRTKHVEKLASDMAGGAWRLNGEPIIFSGRLVLDGQHRLRAIVKANVAVDSVVVRGIDSSVMPTIDTGSKRKLGDALKFIGRGSSGADRQALSAALAVVIKYRDATLADSSSPTIQQSLELLEVEPAILESIEYGRGCSRLGGAGLMTGLHYLCGRMDNTLANRFWSSLADGVGITASDPVYVLRERLLKNQTAIAKIPRWLVAAFAIKAWNAARKGVEVRLMRMQPGEPFPRIE